MAKQNDGALPKLGKRQKAVLRWANGTGSALDVTPAAIQDCVRLGLVQRAGGQTSLTAHAVANLEALLK